MTNDSNHDRSHELSWRLKLRPDQAAELRAWLASHPEAQSAWETDEGLNRALARLPDAPVASNFTARVLQAVERETAARSRRKSWAILDWRPRWAVRVALAACLLVASTLVSFHSFQENQRRQMAESLVAVSQVASLPNPKVLEDFDAILALDQTPADVELLALYR